MSHAIHLSNDLDEPVYVIVSPNKDYVFGEILSAVAVGALVTVATAGFGAGAGAAATAAAVNNLTRLEQVISLLQTIWRITRPVRDVVSAGKQTYQWAKGIGLTAQEIERRNAAASEMSKIKAFFDTNALEIAPGKAVKVLDTGIWNPLSYLGPTGWANITGGSTMSVFVVSASFSRRAMFFTNTDHSWIISRNIITRQKYGNDLFVPDRRAGWYRFAMSDRLSVGQALMPGACLSSPNGDYDFVLEENGDATVYERDKPAGERAIWSSDSARAKRAPGALMLQDDGNLVIYDRDARPVLALDNFGTGPSYAGRQLVMQDDGNLCLIEPGGKVVWASRSSAGFRYR